VVSHQISESQWGVDLELSDELLLIAEERVPHVVRQELDRGSKPTPWFDTTGAAEYTSMSEEAIRAATKRGQLKGYRSETGRIRYRLTDLDNFLQAGGVT